MSSKPVIIQHDRLKVIRFLVAKHRGILRHHKEGYVVLSCLVFKTGSGLKVEPELHRRGSNLQARHRIPATLLNSLFQKDAGSCSGLLRFSQLNLLILGPHDTGEAGLRMTKFA
ncbi:hypothetical protein ACET3Z_019842 [Daucus carota]